MTRSVRTFCRICEVHCGLVVDVEADATTGVERVIKVSPDREHPVSQGYCCVKGLGLGALHHDPDRVDVPLKRVDGELVEIGWDQALSEIGSQVRGIVDEHGPRAVALYQGNPTFFSLQGTLMSTAYVEALGSPNVFASHSIDVNTKFHVSTEMYGLSLVHPVPDFEHLELFMCLGSNPLVSQMSVLQVADAAGVLSSVVDRGGRVIIVDPRRTETARRVGEHVPIRPGTDAYLLAAMLHVLTAEIGLDLAPARKVARGVDEFVAAAAPWTPERAEAVTGISAATIRDLATSYAAASDGSGKGAALYCSTGVNMGPFGSVAYWLIQGINLITGNLDRRGGLLVPRGAFDTLRLADLVGLGRFDEHRTTDGRWHRVAGAFPVAALADEITTEHPDRVRALVRDGRQPRALGAGRGAGRGAPAARPAGEHRPLPQRDRGVRRLRAAGHRHARAQRLPGLAPVAADRAARPVDARRRRAAGAATHGVADLLRPGPGLRGTPLGHDRRARPPPPQPAAGSAAALAPGHRRPPARAAPALGPAHVAARAEAPPRGRPAARDRARVVPRPAGRDTRRSRRPGPGRPRRRPRPARRRRGRPVPARRPAARRAARPALAQLLDAQQLLHPAARRQHRPAPPRRRSRAGHRRGPMRIEVSSPTGAVEVPVSLTDDVARGVVVVPHGWGHATTGPRRARALGRRQHQHRRARRLRPDGPGVRAGHHARPRGRGPGDRLGVRLRAGR